MCIFGLMVGYMRGGGSKERETAEGDRFLLIVVFMMDNGPIINKKDLEFAFGKTVTSMKENGKKTNNMVKPNTPWKTEIHTKEASKMTYSMERLR